jgi:hypothetical protein
VLELQFLNCQVPFSVVIIEFVAFVSNEVAPLNLVEERKEVGDGLVRRDDDVRVESGGL